MTQIYRPDWNDRPELTWTQVQKEINDILDSEEKSRMIVQYIKKNFRMKDV